MCCIGLFRSEDDGCTCTLITFKNLFLSLQSFNITRTLQGLVCGVEVSEADQLLPVLLLHVHHPEPPYHCLGVRLQKFLVAEEEGTYAVAGH